MSQIGNLFRDKLGFQVHKVILILPLSEGKFIEVAQRYFNPVKQTFKYDKTHEYPISAGDWVRQSKNRLIQYKDFNQIVDYGLFESEELRLGDAKVGSIYGLIKRSEMKKPDGTVLTSKELAVNKVADVAKAVVLGGQLNAGVIMLVLALAVGILGGVLVGYFGLPAGLGQHLVANAPK